MIKSVRHVGIVVRDLNQALRLYRDFFGFEIWKREIEEGPYIDKVVGFKNAKIEWIKLSSKDGFIIELLQYYSPLDSSNSFVIIPSNRVGCSHVAFTVEDIDKIYRDLTSMGYHCNAEPAKAPNGAAKVMYCHDADGTILELVEIVE